MGNISIPILVKANTGESGVIIGAYDTSGGATDGDGWGIGFGMGAGNAGKICAWNDQTDSWVAQSTQIDDNSFHLVTVYLHSRGIRFYLDGETADGDHGIDPVFTTSYTGTRYIGSDTSNNNKFNAILDSTWVINKELTSDEKNALWNYGLGTAGLSGTYGGTVSCFAQNSPIIPTNSDITERDDCVFAGNYEFRDYVYMTDIRDYDGNGVSLTGNAGGAIQSGATQGAAGVGANKLWKTSGHATLPDNVIMIGV